MSQWGGPWTIYSFSVPTAVFLFSFLLSPSSFLLLLPIPTCLFPCILYTDPFSFCPLLPLLTNTPPFLHLLPWPLSTSPLSSSLLTPQMIDGEAFLLLTQADIVKIMSVKLGPALKIYNAILMFKNADDTLK